MGKRPPKDRRGLRIVRDRDGAAPEVAFGELSARIPLLLRTDLKICAAEEGETMAEFVAHAIAERIARCRKVHDK